jgi:hypothetical protein
VGLLTVKVLADDEQRFASTDLGDVSMPAIAIRCDYYVAASFAEWIPVTDH